MPVTPRSSAAFGAAVPSEAHALDACRAALALRSLVETRAAGSARLRIGIDSGEAVVTHGPTGVTVTGMLPRHAHQITQALRGAVIALSDEAAANAGGYVSFSAIRPINLTGGRRGRRIFELKAMRQGRSRWQLRADRRLTAFTGRSAEMDLLMRCLGACCRGPGPGDLRLRRARRRQVAAGAGVPLALSCPGGGERRGGRARVRSRDPLRPGSPSSRGLARARRGRRPGVSRQPT